jgi:integrase/recombinase XerD
MSRLVGGVFGEKMNNIKELPAFFGGYGDERVITNLVVPPDEVPAPGPPAQAVDPVERFLYGYSSPRSRQTMLEGLQRVAKVCNVPFRRMRWGELTWAHTSAIQARLAEYRQENGSSYSRATLHVSMAALRGLLLVCSKTGYMTHDAYVSATTGLGKRQGALRELPGRALSRAEVDKLVRFFDSLRGPYGAFLRGLFALFLGGGLRANEVCALPLSAQLERDAAGRGGHIKLVGKGSKEVNQPLGTREVELVEAWLRTRVVLEPKHDLFFARVGKMGQVTSDKPLTPIWVYDLCHEVSDAARVERFMPHDLRRTFATRLYEAGYSDSTVQKLMRHANANTTRRYDRRTRDVIDAERWKVEMWPVKGAPLVKGGSNG